jgi:hypothetical protein
VTTTKKTVPYLHLILGLVNDSVKEMRLELLGLGGIDPAAAQKQLERNEISQKLEASLAKAVDELVLLLGDGAKEVVAGMVATMDKAPETEAAGVGEAAGPAVAAPEEAGAGTVVAAPSGAGAATAVAAPEGAGAATAVAAPVGAGAATAVAVPEGAGAGPAEQRERALGGCSLRRRKLS